VFSFSRPARGLIWREEFGTALAAAIGQWDRKNERGKKEEKEGRKKELKQKMWKIFQT
jgi:hypothetical protein